MKWQKPMYVNQRFGFEVTMYVGIKSICQPPRKARFSKIALGLLTAAALGSSPVVMADVDSMGKNFGSWKLHGFDNHNTGDSSKVSNLNKSNVGNLTLDWIYSIPFIPLDDSVVASDCNYASTSLPCPTPFGKNPRLQPRPYYGAGTGVSVDRKGRVYFPTFDGRMFVLDSTTTVSSPNPAVTTAPSPVASLVMDFFSDPKYIIPGQLPNQNVHISRTFPSLIKNSTFAANTFFFATRTSDGKQNTIAQQSSTPNALNFQSPGAVLYRLDRRTGDLIWKTTVESNPVARIHSPGVTPIYGSVNGPIVVVSLAVGAPSGNYGIFPIPPAAPDPYSGNIANGRGGLAGVRLSDGKVVWKTYSIPQQTFANTAQVIATGHLDAWTGGGTWGGGNIPYSKKLGLVFAGSGEGFSAPFAAQQCELARISDPMQPLNSNKCLQYDQNGFRGDLNFPRNFNNNVQESTYPSTYSPTLPLINSVYAVDVNTGKIKWAQPVHGFDVWNTSCFQFLGAPFINGNVLCSADLKAFPILNVINKDADNATPPTLIENVKMSDGTVRDVIIGGGKEATFYAFDANTGEPLWQPAPVSLATYPTNVPAGVHIGRGGIDGGGFAWGFATDGVNIYAASGASSDVSLAEWKTAKNGGPNPKKVVVDSCIESGFYTAIANDPDQSDNNKIWGGSSYFPDPSDPILRGTGAGGMYAAVNIATGQIAWQRCALGLQGLPNRPLTTLTPLADCLAAGASSGATIPVVNGDQCRPRTTNAAPSVANGVLLVGGTGNYNDGSGVSIATRVPFAEALLLDAKTGALLRELPMGKLGEPAANPMIYSRTISVGNSVYMASGARKVLGGTPAADDITKPFYRVVKYQLPGTDTDKDEKDDDDIREDDN
jgi:coenzyme PQQ precursor peptide PqqA